MSKRMHCIWNIYGTSYLFLESMTNFKRLVCYFLTCLYESHCGCLIRIMNCLPFVVTWVHSHLSVGSMLLILIVYCIVLCFCVLFVFVLCLVAQCCQCLWIYLSWLPPPSVNVASVSGFTFLDCPPPSVSSNVYFSNFSLFVRIQVYSALQCDRQLHLSKSLGHAPIKVCHTE